MSGSAAARFALALGAVLVLAVLVVGGPDDDGEDLAPDGTGPFGAKALLVLLEELGAEVRTEAGIPEATDHTALLLADRLDDERRDDLVLWVEAGGTLVVADPASELTPPVVAPEGLFDELLAETDVDRGTCTEPALGDVDTIDPRGGVPYEVGPGARSCFGDEDRAFVVVADVGEGTVVALGSPGPLLNERIDDQDHAVLAAALLAPTPGGTVEVLLPSAAGAGDEDLIDLMPTGVKLGLVQLALAFAVYVWFRARRVGRPVTEAAPVAIAGSELVAAVGDLLQQARSPERAAAILRHDLRRELGRRLGLPPAAPIDAVVEAVERLGTAADPEQLRSVLDAEARPVTDDQALVVLARQIDDIRMEVLHVHR